MPHPFAPWHKSIRAMAQMNISERHIATAHRYGLLLGSIGGDNEGIIMELKSYNSSSGLVPECREGGD